MTWWNVERSIRVLNQNPRSSLKSGATRRILIGGRFVLKYFNLTHWSKDLYRLRLNTPNGLRWMHDDISDVDSQSDGRDRAMLLLHSRRGKIWVFHLQLNGRDLMTTIHIQVFHLSHWLKMKSQIQRPRPNLPINTHVLRRFKPLRGVSSIELFRHLNPSISCFLHLLDQFPHPRSVWKWDFVEIIGRNLFLNADNCLQNHGMKSLWSGDQMNHFEC